MDRNCLGREFSGTDCTRLGKFWHFSRIRPRLAIWPTTRNAGFWPIRGQRPDAKAPKVVGMEKSISAPGMVDDPLSDIAEKVPRSRRIVLGAAIILVCAFAVGWWLRAKNASEGVTSYRAATVDRGDVIQTVSASGPLSAVSTVNVGSQVSGNISKLHVDFNDPVQVGQVIAEIEPSTYEAALAQAEGDVASARAALELKQLTADRSAQLLAKQIIAQSDYDTVIAELHQQQAAVQVKEATLKSATINLSRTNIRSPINGVVIDRTIDVGQTVQANFSAPTLFVLAQDLRQMQVTANVSEADIGAVATGQPVSFTVDAFPGQAFVGEVREVRNNSTITNNVVTYSTIISVDNSKLKLRPGMTANVIITTARRSGVLRIPNAGLRFHPTPDSNAPIVPAHAGGAHNVYRLQGPLSADSRMNGPLVETTVQTGLSDSLRTEIVSGLDEGAVIATGISLIQASTDAQATTNPFAPKMPRARNTGR